ncbi:MAG: system phosphocarrier protein Hpr [Symbiobacteriaceae bacterium]|jgi:phosphocarrier protein|nr:system phosphocarrier protein Hpr [Symbiobacteriaceae bacterium]
MLGWKSADIVDRSLSLTAREARGILGPENSTERGPQPDLIERDFILANASGLHARPAALFVQTVLRFPGTDVFVRNGPKEVSARSLISVLSLGASKGTNISVRCSGPQETEAMAALASLFESGFGE